MASFAGGSPGPANRPEVDPALVDVDLVDERVGPGEVDPFEQARRQAALADPLPVEGPRLVDEDDLAGLDVLDLGEVHDVQADRLGGEGVGGEEAVAPEPVDEGLDAVGIAEGDHALAGDVGDDGIAAPDLLVDGLDGPEDVLRRQALRLFVGQRLGEQVEDDLEVAVGIEKTVLVAVELVPELAVVGHVAVVGHDDAEGRVDLEGLGVLVAAAADRRVAGVADADRPVEVGDGLGREDVVDEAVALLRVEAAVEGDDPGRVLAAVLHGQQALVDVPDDGAVAPDADDPAHVRP